jgi:hypothetical protein
MAREGGDYAFYLANARKLFWIPLVFGACSTPFAGWTLPIHLAVAGLCLVVPRELSRPLFSLRRFVLTIGLSMFGLLLSISLTIGILVLQEGTLSLPVGMQALLIGLFALLSFFSFLIYRKVWDDRRRKFAQATHGNQLSAEEALQLLMGRSGFSFWRSGAGPSLMTTAAVSGAWIGYRFGVDTQTLVVLTLLFVSWVICVGATVAQCVSMARYPELASIRLYQD